MSYAITAVILFALVAFFVLRKRSNRNSKRRARKFFSVPTLKLSHEHPKGWGSGAVISTIKELPNQDTCSKIVENLQSQGCAIVENMYEELCVEKLNYEVNDVLSRELKNHQEQKSKVQTITAHPGPFIEAVIHSLSATMMKELNIAFNNFHKNGNFKETVYTHKPLNLCKFTGFNAQQLRLRLPGDGLDVHVDRSSAKLTVLYYLNDCEGGEIVLYLSPEEKRLNLEKKSALEKDGGLGIMNELVPVLVKPKLNTLVIFWSDSVPHEVLDINSHRLSFQVFISEEAQKEH